MVILLGVRNRITITITTKGSLKLSGLLCVCALCCALIAKLSIMVESGSVFVTGPQALALPWDTCVSFWILCSLSNTSVFVFVWLSLWLEKHILRRVSSIYWISNIQIHRRSRRRARYKCKDTKYTLTYIYLYLTISTYLDAS